MKAYLLVHGAWHGSWCWKKVAAILRAAGHKVITPDLPWQTGGEQVNASPLQVCVNYLSDLISADDLPLIVVGHSIAGIVISQLAEKIPEQIDALVFISGFLLENGQCANDTEYLMGESLASSKMTMSDDKKGIVIVESALREALYADVDNEDYLFAKAHIREQPPWTFLTPVSLTGKRFGSVPKIYVECSHDRAIPLSAQRAMNTRITCQKVYTLECGHSPFLSMPEDLAEILLSV